MTKALENRIYPVFLPHAGCPYRCVYCNQQAVTGQNDCTGAEDDLTALFLRQYSALTESARRSGISGEIAFYGGTFTLLEQPILRRVLDCAANGVEAGTFTGIRFSTRPDALPPDILGLLSGYPVRTVELGVQSLSDRVLEASARGYSANVVEAAGREVRRRGWRLGIQLMPGLPEDDYPTFLESISGLVGIRPDFARLYPTLVLQNTQLADRYRMGDYHPLSLDEAIEWCASAYDVLTREQIPVIRMGLHSDPELEKPGTVLGGPYHPAFGYLVKARSWRRKVDGLLAAAPLRLYSGKTLLLRVCERVRSELTGSGGENIAYWREKWGIERVKIACEKDRNADWIECSFE